MILIHCYTHLHTLQLEGLMRSTRQKSDQSFVILTEQQFLPLIKKKFKNENLRIISYDTGRGQNFFSSASYIKKNEHNIMLSKIKTIVLPDLSYNMNKILYSTAKARNPALKLHFYYDGMNSVLDRNVTLGTMITQSIKSLVARTLRVRSFVTRKSFNGYKDVSCPISIPNIIYNKISKLNPNYSQLDCDIFEVFDESEPQDKSEKNQQQVIIFINQDITFSKRQSKDLHSNSIKYLETLYPKHLIYELPRDRKDLAHIDRKLVAVYSKISSTPLTEASAEEVIRVIRPDILASHTSSALFNLTCMNFPGEILAVFPEEFNVIAGLTDKENQSLVDVFEKVGMRVIN